MSGKLPSGHTYKELEGEESEVLKERFHLYQEGIVLANPGNYYLPKPFVDFAEKIYNFEEIVWNLVKNPDLNNPEADISIDSRCPFFEVDYIFCFTDGPKYDPKGELIRSFYKHFPDKDPIRDGLMIHLASVHPDPRLLKNHLPYTFLPEDMLKKAKTVCLARDPRDIAVSGYHYHKLQKILDYTGTLEEFVDDFMNDRVPVPFGPWWDHMRLHWEIRNHPNFLLLFYEDLKENPEAEIKKIDKFLGTKRTDEQIKNVARYTSFSNMKERTKRNPPTSFDNAFFKKEVEEKGGSFFRKGKAGSWKEDLPPHLQEKMNSWMKENLTRFDDDFKYKA
ncbi:Sulfotransferase 1 family member D1, partial [Armadillidium nasatum]